MNDHHRVGDWPNLHWNVAGFVCACIPVLAAILVSLGVLSALIATCAAAVAIAYVLFLTWYYARSNGKPKA